MKTKCGRAGRVLLAAALAALLLLTGCASKSRKAAQRLELGQKYLTEMNYTEAVTAFTQVIRLMPENIPAYLGRAEAYVGLEQYEEAKSDYTTVIEKSEKTNRPYTEVQGYMGRANVNELLQENSEALSDYEAAKSLLEQVDWDKFKQVTEKIIRDLLDRIEEACRRLRELLGMEEDADTEEPAENDVFQSAMEQIKAETGLADEGDWDLLKTDYDGDGEEEAFAFGGKMQDGMRKNCMFYYIDPEGNYSQMDKLDGGMASPYGAQADFSDCYLDVGSERLAVFNAGYESSCGFTLLFGVHNGVPHENYVDGSVGEVNADGLIEGWGLDVEYLFKLENGELKTVKEWCPDDVVEPQTYSGSLEQVWEQAKQALIQETNWAGSGYSGYFLPADYDGDGKQEAFAVYGDFNDGLAENFRIFFISSDGTVTRQNTEGLMGGRVFNYENYDGTSDSVLVKAGSRRVFVWEMPGAGNMPTVFFGVKNGQPYVLDISWQYAWFIEDDGHYYVDNGRYDEGSHEIEYNASTWQFELNGNVKYY